MVRFPSLFPSHAFSYCRNKMCFILSLLFLVIGDGNEQANWAWLYLWCGDECVLLAHFWCSGNNHLQRVRCRSLQKAGCSQSCSIYVCEHVLCEVFLFSVCFLKLLLGFDDGFENAQFYFLWMANVNLSNAKLHITLSGNRTGFRSIRTGETDFFLI